MFNYIVLKDVHKSNYKTPKFRVRRVVRKRNSVVLYKTTVENIKRLCLKTPTVVSDPKIIGFYKMQRFSEVIMKNKHRSQSHRFMFNLSITRWIQTV